MVFMNAEHQSWLALDNVRQSFLSTSTFVSLTDLDSHLLLAFVKVLCCEKHDSTPITRRLGKFARLMISSHSANLCTSLPTLWLLAAQTRTIVGLSIAFLLFIPTHSPLQVPYKKGSVDLTL